MQTKPKETPILFSAPMVKAILEGRKTQTRRIIKPQPLEWIETYDGKLPAKLSNDGNDTLEAIECPYGKAGDRLWVRETWACVTGNMEHPKPHSSDSILILYRADQGEPEKLISEIKGWKPSIHMPRAYSRLTLEITGVRVERLQDISEEDAKAEGCITEKVRSGFDGSIIDVPKEIPHESGKGLVGWDNCRDWFADLWESINGPESWEANPFVWVVEFKKGEA